MFKVIIVGLFSCFLGLSLFSVFTVNSLCDENINNKIVVIEGKVTIFEPETEKEFIKERQSLIFQRVDCRKCLSVAFTDEKGNYKILVGEGKYKLIVEEDLSKGGSAIDSDQPRIINATNKVTRNTFDIKLIRHKSPLDITSPLQK